MKVMLEPRMLSCWREINLAAIAHNYRAIRGAVGPAVKIYACLKQDAYGCGAGEVSAVLAAEGVDGFGAVSLHDAMLIRARAPRTPILLYPGVTPQAAVAVGELDLTITISSHAELNSWSMTSTMVSAFIKVDLGFWRAGALPGEVRDLLRRAVELPNIRVRGIYAHLSELPGTGPTAAAQWARLETMLAAIEKEGIRPDLVMLSSSDGVLRHPEMDLDAVDPGALLFGIADMEDAVRPLDIRPVLSAIKARVVSVKFVDDSIGPVPKLPGYKRDLRVGVLAIGWGHGLPRGLAFGASAIVRGKRAPLLAPLHLEHVRIDLSGVPDAIFGDEAVLLGHSGSEQIDLDDLSTHWGDDPVGIHCRLQPSLGRVYLR